MTALRANLMEFWRSLTRLDLLALVVALAGLLSALFGGAANTLSIFGFLRFIGLIAGVYLLFRFIGWWRTRLLWSLRNRLIVAYLFIAVVPVLLILILFVQASRVLYSQFGAYLLYEELHRRVEMLDDGSEHIAAALNSLPPGITRESAEEVLASQSHAVHDRDLPGLQIEFSQDSSLLKRIAPPGKSRFAGLLQRRETLYLYSERVVDTRNGPRVLSLYAPLTPEYLSTIAPDLGAIQLNLMRRFTGGQARGVIYQTASGQYETSGRIVAKNRNLQPAAYWVDLAINGVSRMDSAYVSETGVVDPVRPVFAVFSARASRLNDRIFTSLGELRETYFGILVLALATFFLLELAALITGIVITRRITKAVGELYRATLLVQSGELSHRVRVEQRDQLGLLGESFNIMTGSIGDLIEEQKQRHRLENEISIAREVQNQLFPQKFPEVPGVEIAAICKAARTVSGDYYDFIQLSPTQVAIVIADISGKGISAALLMASLQAALRSQLLAPGSESMSTAELVARINKHLVRNTADDRFATFFIAVYDSSTRRLRYTNAGHLPGFCVTDGSSVHLDAGGMVLGIMENYPYQEGSLVVPPDALLIGYSDGLIEPENVYGEEFGIARLEEIAIRVHEAGPREVAESLMTAAEEWAGTPEQADDMTVIVARLR